MIENAFLNWAEKRELKSPHSINRITFIMRKHSHLPLIGVRVIDFGQQIAGPAVAMILADLGACLLYTSDAADE